MIWPKDSKARKWRCEWIVTDRRLDVQRKCSREARIIVHGRGYCYGHAEMTSRLRKAG